MAKHTKEQKQEIIDSVRAGKYLLHTQTLTPEQVELNERWIEALRSGKYEQGKHVLESNDGCFCCLGVASKVHKNDHYPNITKVLFSYKDFGIIRGLGYIRFATFDDGSLTDYNDYYGWTFEEIADLLEASLESKAVSP